MGLGDFVAKMLVEYKADTSDIKAKIKDLRGEEKKLEKERLKAIEESNKSIDAQIARWLKFAGVIGGAVVAIKGLQKAYQGYLEDVRLESAAAGINVGKLQEATKGLVESDNLLAFAGKTKAGMWRLNEQEMEKVLRGAMAIRKQTGEDLIPIMDKLSESISKGSTTALKEFGIEAKTKTEVLDKLGQKWKEVGGNTDLAGDDMQRAGVKLRDAFDDIAGALGRLVANLEPLISGIARVLDGLSRSGESDLRGSRNEQEMTQAWRYKAAANNDWKAFEKLGGEFEDFLQLRTIDPEQLKIQARELAIGVRDRMYGDLQNNIKKMMEDSAINNLIYLNEDAGKKLDEALHKLKVEEAKKRDRKKSLADFEKQEGVLDELFAIQRALDDHYKNPYSKPRWSNEAAFPGLGGGLGGPGGIDSAGVSGLFASQAQRDSDKRFAKAYDNGVKLLDLQKEAEQRKNIFRSVFGTDGELSAAAIAIEGAAKAMNIFAEATAMAFEAWILGEEGGSKAVRKFLATAIAGIGKELAVTGTKQAVMALVSLATGDPRGAILHTAASAAAFAGSATAFKVAQSMGYGADSSSSAGGRGASAGGGYGAGGFLPSRGSSGGGQNVTNIYLSSDFYELTPGQRRAMVARAARKGEQTRSSNIIDHR